MDNQYLGQEATFKGQLGREAAGYQMQKDEYDMRAEANKGAYLDKALDIAGKAGNLKQTNDIYKQLIDMGYGDLSRMGEIAGIQAKKERKAKRKANKKK